MYQLKKVSHQEAQRMIEAIVRESEKMKKDVAVAISGPEGELIAFTRMDGAAGAAATIAQNKAYTCARDRKSTREMGEFMHSQNRPAAYWGDMGITGFGGGLPIVVENQVIGGIGVSGLSEQEDERLSQLGLKILLEK